MINIINIDKKAFEAFKKASKSTNEKEKNKRVNATVVDSTNNNAIKVKLVGSDNVLSFPNKSGEKISTGDTVRVEYPNGSLSSGYILMRLGSPVMQTGYETYRYITKQTHFPKITDSNLTGIDTICDIIISPQYTTVVRIDLNLLTSFISRNWNTISVYVNDVLDNSYFVQSNTSDYYGKGNLSFSVTVSKVDTPLKISIKLKSSEYYESINKGSIITVSGSGMGIPTFSEMAEEDMASFSSYATEMGGTDYLYNYHGSNITVICPSYAYSPTIKDNIAWTNVPCTEIYFNNTYNDLQFNDVNQKYYTFVYAGSIPNTAKYIFFEGGTVIYDNCCQNNTTLEKIICPLGFASIGNYAFQGCMSLNNVRIKDALSNQTIGNYAFQGCTSLSSIYIPKSVTSIGTSAFAGTALTSVIISPTCTVGENAFPNGCTINYYS